MPRKVLVANRGEVAVRVIRACRELGIRTVAVFSEADRFALHLRYADEAYCIGPAPARESYLCIERILDVARHSGADAVHPGYGFLAENASFAQACLNEGLVFVGPPPGALRLAGNKIDARRAMKAAGLPLIAGTDTSLPGNDWTQAAEAIGFPLMIKAAAGGGGRGIRLVTSQEELPGALVSARREADTAFGDDSVYLERVLSGVRHIEFQILADTDGHIIHLGEREGSMQRRHQKVMEEAPSRLLSARLREEMGEAAVAAARAAGYVNAGTVEFLVDENLRYYFLEINPRLQVEHPTTELVTGIDIVKEQLRIAAGRRLNYQQDDVHLRGWALECRILAENPYQNGMPSTGRITHLREPSGPGVRVESAVAEGQEITPYYDSLISKVVTWGETRAEAIVRMRRALEEYRIMGIRTNVSLYQQVLNDTRFQGGQIHTAFLDEASYAETEAREADVQAAAIVAVLLHHRTRNVPRPLNLPPPGRRRRVNWKTYGRFQAVNR
jgi:acetyl-CoA carboxylase biotin carboxylase subunit